MELSLISTLIHSNTRGLKWIWVHPNKPSTIPLDWQGNLFMSFPSPLGEIGSSKQSPKISYNFVLDEVYNMRKWMQYCYFHLLSWSLFFFLCFFLNMTLGKDCPKLNHFWFKKMPWRPVHTYWAPLPFLYLFGKQNERLFFHDRGFKPGQLAPILDAQPPYY